MKRGQGKKQPSKKQMNQKNYSDEDKLKVRKKRA